MSHCSNHWTFTILAKNLTNKNFICADHWRMFSRQTMQYMLLYIVCMYTIFIDYRKLTSVSMHWRHWPRARLDECRLSVVEDPYRFHSPSRSWGRWPSYLAAGQGSIHETSAVSEICWQVICVICLYVISYLCTYMYRVLKCRPSRSPLRLSI